MGKAMRMEAVKVKVKLLGAAEVEVKEKLLGAAEVGLETQAEAKGG